MSENDYIDDPWFGHGDHGVYRASDGSHHALNAADPLYLSNTYPLANLATAGDDLADDALDHRIRAFHEAGHLWAILSLDRADREEWARTNQRGATSGPARFVAAMGPLAQAAAAFVDQCEFTGADPDVGSRFDGVLSNLPADPNVPPRVRLRRPDAFNDTPRSGHTRRAPGTGTPKRSRCWGPSSGSSRHSCRC